VGLHRKAEVRYLGEEKERRICHVKGNAKLTAAREPFPNDIPQPANNANQLLHPPPLRC